MQGMWGSLLLCQILRAYVRGHMEKLNIYMNKECGEVFSNSYVTDQSDPMLSCICLGG